MSAATNLAPSPEQLSITDFQGLADFVEENPHIFPSMQSARWAIHNRATNGIDEYGVVCKRAGKVLIIVPNATKWLAAGTVGQGK